MIVAKSPLRISLGGGGTDLPSYYSEFGSTFVSAGIDKYVYLAIHQSFSDEFIIKYSEFERVRQVADIRHPLVREALQMAGVTSPLEIVSFADIPAGTGLGSSGAFTVSLLRGLYALVGKVHSTASLAEDACTIEIVKLKEPLGKQDQYASAFSGLKRFDIDRTGKVTVTPVTMPPSAKLEFQERLMLFYTGKQRSASAVLKLQDQHTRQRGSSSESADVIANLHETKAIGVKSYEALTRGDLLAFASLMNEQWEQKKRRSSGTTDDEISDIRQSALNNGALAGKLIGAGGGGFLLFLAEDKRSVRRAMAEIGLPEVLFRIDDLGAQVLVRG